MKDDLINVEDYIENTKKAPSIQINKNCPNNILITQERSINTKEDY